MRICVKFYDFLQLNKLIHFNFYYYSNLYVEHKPTFIVYIKYKTNLLIYIKKYFRQLYMSL